MNPELVQYKYIFMWLSILISIEAIALYSVQNSTKTNNFNYVYLAMMIYGLFPLLLNKLLHFKSIAVINFLWNIFSTCTGFIITIVIFKEAVSHLECMGALLGLFSIGLIVFGSRQKIKERIKI